MSLSVMPAKSGRVSVFPRLMSGVAVAVTLIALPSAQTGQSQPTRLHLASTPWPPFTNPPGKARFASDLVDEALKRVGITADTTIVDEGALTAALRSGRFDGSAALWKDEGRESFLIFSEAYLQNRLVLVGRHGSNVSAASIADLAGKRLAVVQSYSYGDAVRAGSAPRFIQVPTEEESVRRLLAGDVDYALIDELVVAFLVQNYPQEVSTRLAVGSVALVVRPLHFAVRRALPGAQSIIDRFNSVLGAMVADRSYHRLLHIPWIEADIDHDGKAEYVPATDQVSKEAPKGGYRLFSNEGTPESPTPTPRRFYVGGSIYEEWTSVPDAYKVQPAGAPAAFGGSTASVFSFKW